ncbi:hypothetical protein VNI00_018465 [Paramarasmius palmivorus]|uniref:Uncharacterized protein n=1 Tax=Paramarasmius palmivorus TaxID=297713 RepID=A0AAW0AXH1_9AGAR
MAPLSAANPIVFNPFANIDPGAAQALFTTGGFLSSAGITPAPTLAPNNRGQNIDNGAPAEKGDGDSNDNSSTTGTSNQDDDAADVPGGEDLNATQGTVFNSKEMERAKATRNLEPGTKEEMVLAGEQGSEDSKYYNSLVVNTRDLAKASCIDYSLTWPQISTSNKAKLFDVAFRNFQLRLRTGELPCDPKYDYLVENPAKRGPGNQLKKAYTGKKLAEKMRELRKAKKERDQARKANVEAHHTKSAVAAEEDNSEEEE